MSDWTDGYVGDMEYTAHFFADQAPAHLDLVCLINGVAPVERDRGFTYCELACGQGFTTNLLAATHPQGRFWAIDFNPAHIARARRLAGEAGLDNVEFLEAAFDQFLDGGGPPLPPFDMITLHGVYSWVSPRNRQAIVSFLDRFLKPGGVVYVSYNALPGWTSIQPLQRLLNEVARLAPGDRVEQLRQGLAFARDLLKVGSRAFPEKLVEELFKRGDTHVAYLVHEYLNDHWQPLYHAEVAKDMAGAKLDYVGSASLFENFPDLDLTPDQRTLLERIPDPIARETLKDYCRPRGFRKDVYVRGRRPLAPHYRDRLLEGLRFALAVAPGKWRLDYTFPVGEVELNRPFYEPVFRALETGPHSLSELMALAQVPGKTNATPSELAGVLAGTHQALALPHTPDATALERVRRFNRAHLRHILFEEGQAQTALACAGAGVGVSATVLELVTYDGLAAGVPAEATALAHHAWQVFLSHGERLRGKDGLIEGEEAHLATFAAMMPEILGRHLTRWRALGTL